MTDDAVEAAAEYRVEIDPHHPGCECCGKGCMWWIVDSEGVGGGASYGDECTAEEEAGALNFAFERGFLSAALAAAEAAAWQPIETALRDRMILVYAPAYEGLPEIVGPCRWHEDAGFCVDELRFPTLWRLMPAPPTAISMGSMK